MWRRKSKFRRCKGYSYYSPNNLPQTSSHKKSLWKIFRSGLLLIAELAVIGGMFTFFLERQDATTARINAAWQLVVTKAPGNSGKIEALEYLNSWQCFFLDKFDWFHADKVLEMHEFNETPFIFNLLILLKESICLKKPVPLTGIDLSPPQKKSQNVAIDNKTYLNQVNLSGANLSFSNLSNSNLAFSKMDYSDASHANFSYSDLEVASFANAELVGAIFIEADLAHATLQGANLFEADLSKADLSHANLMNSTLANVNFTDTDLNGAILLNADFTINLDKNNIEDIEDVCRQLKLADNWEFSFRDKVYACGTFIPIFPGIDNLFNDSN